eukprot:365219-Chlamydomonas_euryale.AAC.1
MQLQASRGVRAQTRCLAERACTPATLPTCPVARRPLCAHYAPRPRSAWPTRARAPRAACRPRGSAPPSSPSGPAGVGTQPVGGWTGGIAAAPAPRLAPSTGPASPTHQRPPARVHGRSTAFATCACIA